MFKTEGCNIIGWVEGSDSILKNEYVVVGAHYDHLGYGGAGSLAPNEHRIHPGADDNASGVAVMLDVAHRLASAGPFPRRIIFVAFSGEEIGLLGSSHFVKHVPVPDSTIVAMVNFDMVGRMVNRRVMVLGCGSYDGFGGILDAAMAGQDVQLVRLSLGVTPSDQLPFVVQQIPALHFFTGMHADYHRPSDTASKLNVDGMRLVSQIATGVVSQLARLPDRPRFTAAPNSVPSVAKRAFLGGVPGFDDPGPGCRLVEVVPGGPAERAGVRAGDVILQLGGWKVDRLDDLIKALEHCREGQPVPVILQRGNTRLTVEVRLSAGM